MKIGIALAIIAFAALRGAAQGPCADAVNGKPVKHTANYTELVFPRALDGAARVRVFDQNGKLVDHYEVTASEMKPGSTTYRSDFHPAPFDPATQFVATTASTGCVRGVAYRPAGSGCVASFKLQPLSLQPVDVEIVAPFATIDVTRKLSMTEGGNQCTETYLAPRGAVITGVIEGESIRLGLRREAASFEFEVNVDLLRDKKEYKPSLIDAAKISGATIRGGTSLNAAAGKAADVDVTLRVRK